MDQNKSYPYADYMAGLGCTVTFQIGNLSQTGERTQTCTLNFEEIVPI